MKSHLINNTQPQFANPAKRTPVVLMIDTSGSTLDHAVLTQADGSQVKDQEPKHLRFQQGLQTLRECLSTDHWFAHTGELATVTFGATIETTPFQPIGNWTPPTLDPQGATPTGAALNAALDLAQDRLLELDDEGVLYYQPQIALITDGKPYGEHEEYLAAALERARELESMGHVSYVTIGVDEDDCQHLTDLGFRNVPLIVSRISWREVFVRLSQIVSRPRTQRGLRVNVV